MLQGVNTITQKCQPSVTPNFLQGVNGHTQERHKAVTPNFFTGGQTNSAGMPFIKRPKGEGHFTYAAMLENNRLSPLFQGSYDVRSNVMQGTPRLLQGAAFCPQQCHNGCAPTSFIWCREIIAAMLIQKRTKGRVMDASQQCHIARALPNQFNGVIVKTQKCLDIVAPREGPPNARRNVADASPFPPSYRGPSTQRRNAIDHPPPPNLGRQQAAEMPWPPRPITRGHPSYAEMPPPLRLAI